MASRKISGRLATLVVTLESYEQSIDKDRRDLERDTVQLHHVIPYTMILTLNISIYKTVFDFRFFRFE